MAQVITLSGERLFALKAQNNQQLDIDTFIFAYVPGQDSTAQIDRNEDLPPVNQRVHQQIVQQYGMLNDNAVVYSSVLDSLTGPFQFNWVGLYSAVNQTLVAIQHIPTVVKTVTEPGASGNILNRNFVIEYSGIAELTGITVDPTTWQYDFNARLNGMDELTRQLAADMNGKDWFIDDGFKVVPRSTLNTFKVTAGAGYVSGLRVELAADHILTLSSYPQFVYVDAWFDGTSESVWKGHTAFTVTNTEMDDYIDVNGRNHYVFKLARITAADAVEDLRTTEGLKQEIDNHKTNGHDFYNKHFSVVSNVIIDHELKQGMIVSVDSYGDNSEPHQHYRSIDTVDDGSGIALENGLYANLIINDKTIYAADLGFEQGDDVTGLLNGALKNKVTAESINKFVLDCDVIINDPLDYAYSKVSFVGEGVLKTANKDNVLQRLNTHRTDTKVYSGLLNSGFIDNEASYSAIFEKREFIGVLFGDSVSVSSDYDSATIPLGAQEARGVDNYSNINCLGSLIFAELRSMLPADVRVKLYCRAIGGLSYSNIDAAWDTLGARWEGREQVTAGKSWRDCVLDLKPDLVIHSMGMNHSPQDFLDNFLVKWNSYLYTEKKTASFDQAIVTTPNPNYENAQQFGDFRQYGLNASKFFVQQQQRQIAKELNISIIDVAFNSYLKRYGIDVRSCSMSKNAEALKFADGTSEKTLVNGGGKYPVHHSEMPIFHSTSFYITSTKDSSAASYDVKFNAGDCIIQFSSGLLQIYSGIFPVAGVFLKGVNYILPANTRTLVTVTVLPSGISVYINDVLLISYHKALYKDTIDLSFESSNTTLANVHIDTISTFAQHFPRYTVDTGNNEIYGKLNYTENKYGGGINHPSCAGLVEIYLPPIREFINSILNHQPAQLEMLRDNALNELIHIGRIAKIPYNVVEVYEKYSGCFFRVTVSPDATSTSVVNRANLPLYIDNDFNVYIKLTKPITFKQLERKGIWSSTKIARYGNSVPDAELVPAENAFEIKTEVDGVVTVKGITVISSPELTRVVNIPIPVGGALVHSSASIAVNSETTYGGNLSDKVNTTMSNTFLSYSLVFDGAPSAVGRRFNYEYSYVIR
ncbi:phage tail-collar fiber domain-containing protein [Shewanella baltica]|uniref:phage tail-collar fiber domain-containing protein n=1 Tax=Shewanella baltica TaxID=62322 RepID=UPI00217D988E|nr:phage tail protein [Shewanella baltica]